MYNTINEKKIWDKQSKRKACEEWRKNGEKQAPSQYFSEGCDTIFTLKNSLKRPNKAENDTLEIYIERLN